MQKKLLRNSACLCICVLFLFVGCATVTQVSSEQIAEPEVLAEFAIPSGAKLISLPVKFDGEEYQFILDTGSTTTIFDVSLKDKLGKRFLWPQKGTAAHGKPITAEFFHAPHAHLGSLCLKKCGLVAVLDLTSINSCAGQKVDGIIGMSFLKRYVVQIDFDNRKVSFLKSKKEGNIFSFLGPTTNEHPQWGLPSPIRFEFLSNRPFVKGIIGNNISADFLIDTGATNAYHLKSGIFSKVQPKSESIVKEGNALTAGGTVSLASKKIKLIDKFSVGSIEYGETFFLETNRSLLGLEFLSQHLVTFDFPNRKMYLKKGKYFGRLGEHFSFSLPDYGFGLARKETDIVIDSVEPNSTAETKGVEKDDIVLKINNHEVSSFSMTDLWTFLLSIPKNSEKFAITLKRGDEIIEVVFVVEKKE